MKIIFSFNFFLEITKRNFIKLLINQCYTIFEFSRHLWVKALKTFQESIWELFKIFNDKRTNLLMKLDFYPLLRPNKIVIISEYI